MENSRGLVECKKCGSETPKNTRFCVNCGASLALDTTEKRLEEHETPSQSTGLDRQPEPRGCLAAFLVILMIANGINTVIQIFRLGKVLLDPGPDVTVFSFVSGAILILAVSTLPILFSYAIWKWKRWVSTPPARADTKATSSGKRSTRPQPWPGWTFSSTRW